jgi:endonuclease YncB( thermonuclease family)
MLHRLRLVVWPLLALLLSAAATAAQPGSVQSVVVRVIDGDTIHVRVAGRLERVRYIGCTIPRAAPSPAGKRRGRSTGSSSTASRRAWSSTRSGATATAGCWPTCGCAASW